MKLAVFVLFIAFCILKTSAHPIEDEADSQVARVRVRRFTCDVLSAEGGSIKVNHSACALHCLSIGKSGGYCNSQAVCICR